MSDLVGNPKDRFSCIAAFVYFSGLETWLPCNGGTTYGSMKDLPDLLNTLELISYILTGKWFILNSFTRIIDMF